MPPDANGQKIETVEKTVSFHPRPKDERERRLSEAPFGILDVECN